MKKRANILTENIIFIILNLAFLTILFLFVFSKMGAAAILEEKYAKQIALLIDASEPGMKLELEINDMIKEKEKKFPEENIVTIHKNIVTVKIREKGGYSYSYFNDINVTLDIGENKKSTFLFLTLSEKNE